MSTSMTQSTTQTALSLPKETRILLIDNDPNFVATCKNMFEKGGFKNAQIIHSFEELMPLVTHMMKFQWTFDIILAEIELPMISGLEMVTQMQQMPQFAGTPVIMFSSSGSIQHLINAFQKGVDDFIFKPINPAELMMRMARIVRKEISMAAQTSKAKFLEKEIAELKSLLADPVTDLPNTYSFSKTLEKRLANSNEDLPFLLIEVDEYDHYRSTYGEEHAHKCLQAIAGELVKLSERKHQMGALENGRFAMALEQGTSLPELKKLGQEVGQHVQALFIPHEKSADDTTLSVSVGALQVMVTKEAPNCELDIIPIAERALAQAQSTDDHFHLMLETL